MAEAFWRAGMGGPDVNRPGSGNAQRTPQAKIPRFPLMHSTRSRVGHPQCLHDQY